MPESPLYTFNGINPLTGEYLVPPLPAADIARVARGERIDKDHALELKTRVGASDKHFGVKYGVDPRDLAQTGWGVIFAENADPSIYEALEPLRKWRSEQAGQRNKKRYQEYTGAGGYKAEMSSLDFLEAHDAGPGPAEPDHVPYYLLLVGGPEVIPYDFQYQLDVQYAVGRLAFDKVEDYHTYARTVVFAEQSELALPRHAAFWGVGTPGDYATQLSSQELIGPLADTFSTNRPDWRIEKCVAGDATKARLTSLFAESARPSLLFTASHGLGLPMASEKQSALNGALLCQDWPGPGNPCKLSHYFSAEDVPADTSLVGLVAFFFACFGAGTPDFLDFADPATGVRGQYAKSAFAGRLPQRLLAHPNGGALAVVGHIDRVFASSFHWERAQSPQLEVFQSTLGQLMDGYPVGAAMEFFNMRYAELSTLLTQRLDDIRVKMKRVDDAVMANLWLSNLDARNFVILGDPAVRLKLAADPAQEKKLRLPESAA